MRHCLVFLALLFLSPQLFAQLTSATNNHSFGNSWGLSRTSTYQENMVDLFLPNDPGGNEPWELSQITISVEKYDLSMNYIGTVSATLSWSGSRSLGTWYSTSAGSKAKIKIEYIEDRGWARKYKVSTRETKDFVGYWCYGKPTITAVTKHNVTHQTSSKSGTTMFGTYRYNFEPDFPYPTNISININPLSDGITPGTYGNDPNITYRGRIEFQVNWDFSESFNDSYIPTPHGNPSVSFMWEARGGYFSTIAESLPKTNTWYKIFRGRDSFVPGYAQSLAGDGWPYMNAPWFENPLQYKIHFKLEWKHNGISHSTKELNMHFDTGWRNFIEVTDNYHFIYTNPGVSNGNYYTLKGSYKMGSDQSEYSDEVGFYWGATSNSLWKKIVGTHPSGDLRDHQYQWTVFRPHDNMIYYKAYTEYGDGNEMYGSVKKLLKSSIVIENLVKSSGNDSELDEDGALSQKIIKPDEYILETNYPNPFNPSTEISFGLPKSVHAKLVVYNSQGKEVSTLVDQPMAAGFHKVNFDAAGLASGIYFYTLLTDDFIKARKMILMK